MTTTTLRILIADDHEVMRNGTRALIERQPGWEVCGIAATWSEAAKQALALKPEASFGFVKSYCGFMSVYSDLGRGTTFHIFLPAKAMKARCALKQKRTGEVKARSLLLSA